MRQKRKSILEPSPFMNKAIYKAVMDRTRLRNKFLEIDLRKINWLIIAEETTVCHSHVNR